MPVSDSRYSTLLEGGLFSKTGGLSNVRRSLQNRSLPLLLISTIFNHRIVSLSNNGRKGDVSMAKMKEAKKEVGLLKELCGDDVKLYDCLSNFLYENPSTVMSEKDIDTLAAEAEKSGQFGIALDKAIFKASQNLGERERYIKSIQSLALKSLHATERDKERAEKEGLTEMAAAAKRRIEHQKLLSERTEAIINIASRFYNEKLAAREAGVKKEAQASEKRGAEREEIRIDKLEKAAAETRKKGRKGMGRKERKEAKKLDKAEKLAAGERKETREKKRQESEKENN